jgi:hypothetical protein
VDTQWRGVGKTAIREIQWDLLYCLSSVWEPG